MMPETVLAVTAVVETIGGLLAGAVTASALTSAAVSIGVGVGLNYLATALFTPTSSAAAVNRSTVATATKPEAVQQSFRQNIAPRIRHYGRVKVSGPWVFFEALIGTLFKVIVIAHGRIDEIEEWWVDDQRVFIDSGGVVTGGKFDQQIVLQYRKGVVPETVYSDIATQFSGTWGAAHRGDGIASVYIIQRPIVESLYLSTYPNGINTLIRAVIRGAIIYNPVGGVDAWSDNPSAILRDYLTSVDGARIPESLVTTSQALQGWIDAYNRCAESIQLASGGVEPRYRIWGSYSLEERPADVIKRLMDNCDGRLIPTPDGGLILDVGDHPGEPDVTIDTTHIEGFEISPGRDILNTANVIRAVYLEPNADYQTIDADPWMDSADIAERGEVATSIDLSMTPSHSQARRLMKLAYFRSNPRWVGTLTCNVKALEAFGERFIRVTHNGLGINGVFELIDFKFDISPSGTLEGVTLQVQAMPATAYDWDSSQEGASPSISDTDVDGSIPTPAAPTVNILGGPVASLSFTPSDSILLDYRVNYKKTSDSVYTTVDLANDASSYTTPTLASSTSYDFRLQFITDEGREGPLGPVTTQST